MNIVWRVVGLALVAGLALFLISLIVKFVLVASVLFLVVRTAGRRLAGQAFGRMGPGSWSSSNIISIDNPGYRSPMHSGRYDRVIAIG